MEIKTSYDLGDYVVISALGVSGFVLELIVRDQTILYVVRYFNDGAVFETAFYAQELERKKYGNNL